MDKCMKILAVGFLTVYVAGFAVLTMYGLYNKYEDYASAKMGRNY